MTKRLKPPPTKLYGTVLIPKANPESKIRTKEIATAIIKISNIILIKCPKDKVSKRQVQYCPKNKEGVKEMSNKSISKAHYEIHLFKNSFRELPGARALKEIIIFLKVNKLITFRACAIT